MRVLVSAGRLCDRWRENPGAGRPGLQRNGHPGGQAGPLHGLRRGAVAAVPACHAGRGDRQWGENLESSNNQEFSWRSRTIVLFYSKLWKSPAFQIAFSHILTAHGSRNNYLHNFPGFPGTNVKQRHVFLFHSSSGPRVLTLICRTFHQTYGTNEVDVKVPSSPRVLI